MLTFSDGTKGELETAEDYTAISFEEVPEANFFSVEEGKLYFEFEGMHDDITDTVKKDGTGASGTWGISITGNAATATKATQDGSGNTITSTSLQLALLTILPSIQVTSSGISRGILVLVMPP